MVVLSVGLQIPRTSVACWPEQLGIELNKYNFVAIRPLLCQWPPPGREYTPAGSSRAPRTSPPRSPRPAPRPALAGVGTWRPAAGPKRRRSSRIPAEIDVDRPETPRIGVFVCNCGINIGGIVKVPGRPAITLRHPAPRGLHRPEPLHLFSQDTQDKIKDKIKEHRPQPRGRGRLHPQDPRTHVPWKPSRPAGINKYLFEMANIRNQDSWIHSNDTRPPPPEKAKDLVRAWRWRAPRNAASPAGERRFSIIPRALVVGGGVAGMNAALGLANQGFEAVMVEKEEKLGGLANGG